MPNKDAIDNEGIFTYTPFILIIQYKSRKLGCFRNQSVIVCIYEWTIINHTKKKIIGVNNTTKHYESLLHTDLNFGFVLSKLIGYDVNAQ